MTCLAIRLHSGAGFPASLDSPATTTCPGMTCLAIRLHSGAGFPACLASRLSCSFLLTRFKKSTRLLDFLMCSTRTEIRLAKIFPRTRLFTTTPTACLDTLKTRPFYHDRICAAYLFERHHNPLYRQFR